MRIWAFIGIGMTTALVAGCRAPVRTPWDNLREAQESNTELSLQVQSLEKENEQLRRQVATLSGMEEEKRLEELNTLTAIKLHRRTGLLDKNNDGTSDTLMVYLQTLDAQQDSVKAAGRCVIQLWNLAETSGQAKLAEWTMEPADLQTLWGGTIFAQYYRIALPLADTTAVGEQLTVRAVFTDLLRGKVLSDQLPVIEQ